MTDNAKTLVEQAKNAAKYLHGNDPQDNLPVEFYEDVVTALTAAEAERDEFKAQTNIMYQRELAKEAENARLSARLTDFAHALGVAKHTMRSVKGAFEPDCERLVEGMKRIDNALSASEANVPRALTAEEMQPGPLGKIPTTSPELLELIERAKNHVISPEEHYEQRRSFVRGMCPSNRDYSEWCKEVDRIIPPLSHTAGKRK